MSWAIISNIRVAKGSHGKNLTFLSSIYTHALIVFQAIDFIYQKAALYSLSNYSKNHV